MAIYIKSKNSYIRKIVFAEEAISIFKLERE